MSERARAHAALLSGLVFALSVSAFVPILGAYFRTDDFGYLGSYWRKPSQSLSAFFFGELLEQQHIWGEPTYAVRPVISWFFRINTLLFGTDPVGYHLFGVLLHGGTALVVLAIARKVVGAPWFAAAFAAALFGVLPVHAEPVAWISSVGDVVVAFFTLLAFLAFGLARQSGGARAATLDVAAGVAFACALFTKESALALVALFPVWHLIQRERGGEATSTAAIGLATLVRSLPVTGVFVVYVVIRFLLVSETVTEQPPSPVDQLAVFATRQPFYLGSLLHPELGLKLLPGHSLLDPMPRNAVGGARTAIGAGLFGLFVVLGAWAVFARRLPLRLRQALVLGPAWYALATLPLAVTYATDRHLYLPSAGPCLAIACLPCLDLRWAGVRRRIVTFLAAAALLAAAWVGLLHREYTEAERGEVSRSMSDGVIAAASELAPGSRLIVLPELQYQGRWLWRWSLPFALRPPFAPYRLYRRFDIVESPGAYCCPLPLWWRDRKKQINSWPADGGAPVWVLSWSPQQQRVITRQVSSAEVSRRLRQLRAQRDAPATGTITAGEAVLLIEGLRD